MNILKQLLEEIEKLKQSEELLEQIWSELGPYSTQLPDSLMNNIRKYFKFDDSE